MNTTRGALLTAGALLAMAAGLTLAVRFDLITIEAQLRMMGVATGLVLVMAANIVPKRIKPLASEQCDPARAQALRRFAGWSLTLGGLGHVMAWLILPVALANLAAMSIVAVALLLVAARVVVSLRTRSREQDVNGAAR